MTITMLSSIILFFLLNQIIKSSSSSTTNRAYYHCKSSSNFNDETNTNQTLNLFLFAMPTNMIGQNVYYFARSTKITSSTTLSLLQCLGLCQVDMMYSSGCFSSIHNSYSNIGKVCPKILEITPPMGYDQTSNSQRVGICVSNLSQSDCNACLKEEFREQNDQRYCQGVVMYSSTCNISFESYYFHEFLVPSRAPWTPVSSTPRKERKNNRTIVTAIVVPLIVLFIVAISLTIIICKKREKNQDDQGGGDSDESCIEFSLRTISGATNDFSPNNILGRGGFGQVYKGRLGDGKKVAVKRLISHSSRGEVEFKNEVKLVAKLHHKNLIKLIGLCIQGNERILIFEFAPNGSLDRLLFDSIERREHLSWQIRRNVIEGIARGMLYLHEESQLRIIHCDLKASNILLDESMNPKISDFGTARLFMEDKTSSSKIVGTYGYMAPEYAKHGKISVKIDVFSFGVLLLEILCGRKNGGSSQNPTHVEHLLSKAWKYWTRGKQMELIDPILITPNNGVDHNEITQSIHIGLLCVQEDANIRPTMNLVVLMLQQGCSMSLPSPRKPAYFMANESEHNKLMIMNNQGGAFESGVNSGISSITEVSISTYLEPR